MLPRIGPVESHITLGAYPTVKWSKSRKVLSVCAYIGSRLRRFVRVKEVVALREISG
jgi:hypothetical protein